MHGHGTIKFNDELMFKGNFDLKTDLKEIWNNRQNVFFFEVDKSSVKQSLSELPFSPWHFEGETSNGRKIIVENMAMTQKNEKINGTSINVQLGFSISELTVGNQQSFDRIVYSIPNFLIGFDQYSNQQGNIICDNTNFTLEYKGVEYCFQLKAINNSASATHQKQIIEKDKDIVTVHMTINRVNEKINYEEAIEVVNIILDLCTIANGGRVSWTTCYGIEKEKEILRTLRDVPFSHLKPFRTLIRISHPEYLSSYIKSTFPSYSSLGEEERFSYMKLIEGIHFSALRLNFPAPFVILGSVIEDFTNSVLAENATSFINKADRRALFPDFQRFIEKNVLNLIEENDKTFFEEKELKQKLSGLMQKNLRARILTLLTTFQVEHDLEWVRNFVRKRNDAAHGNYKFAAEEDYLIWSKMVSLLEKLVLSKLNYNGEYLDWSVSPPQRRNL